jgi:GDPmannose 4,6-dehydratase
MKTALVTGVAGQDGFYLAGQLLEQGWRVLGTVRDPSGTNKHLVPVGVELVEWDADDSDRMVSALRTHRPDAIYNLAARASGAEMFDDPAGMGTENGIRVARLLDAIRKADPAIRFCQASSSEMFGRVKQSPQSESAQFFPRSPYGVAKLYAHTMVDVYRRQYKLFACSAILYNHESPRRGDGFVTGKIARAAVRIRLGLESELKLGNLEARRDWGYAPDYMHALYLMLQPAAADDYVIATGVTHSVREFCELAFFHVGLDYRDYVRDDPTAHRASVETALCGDAAKAARVLGWYPRTDFPALVRLMVNAEMMLHNP